ncbi:tyrosine-protein kinase CSK-like isoform X1 [Pectinophora gossypiella]|uniref:tyrosine-protein kinase CSK-like isoform X1 n=2 Tax=Pectinophora gossypiella TaxID=13191 RepID=UPI00214EE027|nr:tyrosine-protein kinase CSK-like isoform X1 [Pectinophora gossypiella]XP_049872012.1 tyrosine-protein kinase CSK-like isoform X1 [Pectinophora gossypiella]XP_049872013.1 tyrosine-protein kinase CSK-like isoform X1 [Pectinophora gossypiella]
MNSDVHRHQAHPPLAQHGPHGGGSGPCGWYSASAAPAPTAPARLKRAQPPHHLPSGGGVSSNGPHAPLSPTALQNSVPHNNVMSSSVRAPAPVGPAPSAMHTSQTSNAVAAKGPSDVLVNSSAQNPPPAGNRLVNMTQWPWHHGAISRERAEALLSGSPDGVFLVRESTNFPGDHTLCVRYRGHVEHYRVKWASAPDSQNQRLTIDDEEFFDNMTDLIHHYLQDADGLCTKLVRCLPKATPNGANNNGAHQPPYPPHPQQPPPYPPTPSVPSSLSHFQPTYSTQVPPSIDQTDAAQQSQKFVDARWIIAERDLEIRENIGKGEFGDVMLGILNGSQKVAVKILKDREAASKFRAEASVMASLKHDNLVRLLGLVFASNGSTCIVTEHCAQGSLLDYLRSRGRHYVTQLNQINFAYDTCCGMEYLERQRVVHRDLAARNVLISAEGAAKVADFGLARADAAPDDAADAARLQAKLPIKWTAPEALKYNKFSNKSDMWSFGILLWEIYSFGRVPYPRIPLAEVVRHVERGYRMEAPEGCPGGPYEVMRAAWHADPAARPSFAATRARLAAMRDAARALPQPAPPHP